MKNHDVADGNVAKIAALFPLCITERLNKDGKLERVIDFDNLRDELSKDLLEGAEERYQFTLLDKRAASRLANELTNKKLLPDVDAPIDFWNTENLYIEGDNLDVLKVLRENGLGAIKMIYIDPPDIILVTTLSMTTISPSLVKTLRLPTEISMQSVPITNSVNVDIDELDSHIGLGKYNDNSYSRYGNQGYGY